MKSLSDFRKQKDFFVGIDSDGCVFDSMEIKHKECFCPAFVNHYDLQGVSRFAREVWEFVNLYSTTRGVNRFKAVLRALELCRERPEVEARGVEPPQLPGLIDWTSRESKLGNPALEAEVAASRDPDLVRALAWSKDVNDAVAKIVRNVPPFPSVGSFLSAAGARADLMVVSQTPLDALEREWEEHGIAVSVDFIAGQELGTKGEHLQGAAADYKAGHILMIGDAPGDKKAADAVDAFFFPIIPGREEECWQELVNTGLGRFFSGTFAGDYERSLLGDFQKALPERPPWK